MRLSYEVALRSFRRWTSYRAATIAGIITNSFFGCIRALIFIALYHAHGTIAGYDLTDAITFVALGQGILMMLYLWGWWEVAETIKTGSVVTDLSRPYDYYAYWLARDMGRAVYHLLFRGMTSFIVIALIFGARFPASPVQWLTFAFSLILAAVTSFAFRFIINISAFWLLDVRGIGGAATIAATLFSGFEVPLVYFPGWLLVISNLLPFRGMMQTPADIFLGHLAGTGALAALALQALWCSAL
ncbi:MAG: ABC-2 family transporter protein, partial [Thermomicrobia bacterium]|nr:ABC-2 family transporter protein [Thermomicrobia bacterium]